MDGRLRVGIIGLRHLHPRAYMPLFEGCAASDVVCACEQDAGVLDAFCSDFGVRGYPRLDEMLGKEKIEVAAIFLPHCECAAAAVTCAENSIHLMIEKPMAESSDGVEEVISAAEKNDVLVTTGYCWRFHPVVRKIKSEMDRGVLGKIVSIEARLAAGRVERYIRGHCAWMLEKGQSGGGPMYNLGVHWVDLLCHLLSDEVTEVCAVNINASGSYDIEDGSMALLRFRSGVFASLSVSYIVPDCFPGGRDLYIGIQGAEGTARYSPKYEGEEGSGAFAQREELEICSDSAQYEGAAARKFVFELDKTVGYSGSMGKAYIEDFTDAVLNARKPAITAGQALRTVKVVEAIYRSADMKKWVDVVH